MTLLNNDIANNSIILIGPVGAGKSLIANELGKKIKMPVVSTDILRFCPMNVEDINSCQKKLNDELMAINQKIEASDSLEIIKNLKIKD